MHSIIDIGLMAIVNLIKHIYHYRHHHHDFLASRACGNFHYNVLYVLQPSNEYCQPLAHAEISINIAFFPSLIGWKIDTSITICQPCAPTEIAILAFFMSFGPPTSIVDLSHLRKFPLQHFSHPSALWRVRFQREIAATLFIVTKGQRFGESHYVEYERTTTGNSVTNLSFNALYN